MKQSKKKAGARPSRALSSRSPRRGGEKEAWRKIAATVFPRLMTGKRRFGIGVILAMVKRAGEETTIRSSAVEESNERPGERPRGRLLARIDAGRLSRLFSGLSHPDRVCVLRAILSGCNTHRTLKETTKLKTGPLYFHVRGLEAAGMVERISRNSYLPTTLGEDVLIVNSVLASQKAVEHAKSKVS